jgi:hypothetical protein
VIIKVVAAQVRECDHIKQDIADSRLRKGVGRNLHDNQPDARIRHCLQQSLKLHGLGGCMGRRLDNRPPGNRVAIIHRADDTYWHPQTDEHLFEEIGNGRLAVGAGDTDKLQTISRMTVIRSRQLTIRHSGVLHLNEAHIFRARGTRVKSA